MLRVASGRVSAVKTEQTLTTESRKTPPVLFELGSNCIVMVWNRGRAQDGWSWTKEDCFQDFRERLIWTQVTGSLRQQWSGWQVGGVWCAIWTEDGRQGNLVAEWGSTGERPEEEVGESQQEYKVMQHMAKREAAKAKQRAYDELHERLDSKDGGKAQYCLARQRDQPGRMCSRFGWLSTGIKMH